MSRPSWAPWEVDSFGSQTAVQELEWRISLTQWSALVYSWRNGGQREALIYPRARAANPGPLS